jgi:hypothetical protein
MLARYRNGCLNTIKRKDGIERWLFRWRERHPDGAMRERNKVIGSVREYPEKSKKLHEAVAKLRLNINTDGPTELTSITMAKALQHYTVHELGDCGEDGKAYSTRIRKTQLLHQWVLPQWGKFDKKRLKTNLDVHLDHVRDSGVIDAIRLAKLWGVRNGPAHPDVRSRTRGHHAAGEQEKQEPVGADGTLLDRTARQLRASDR